MRRIVIGFALIAAAATTACSSSPTAPATIDAQLSAPARDGAPADTTKRSGYVLPQG